MRDLADGCRPSETMRGTRVDYWPILGVSVQLVHKGAHRSKELSVRLAVHAKERLARAENKRNRGNREGKDWSKWICTSTYTDSYVCVLVYE